MPSRTESTREIPNWVSALILLLVLAGGAWGVWSYFERGAGDLSASAAVTLTDANVDGPALPRTGRRRQFYPGGFAAFVAANMPDGIMPTGNGYLVKSGTARLDIEPPFGNNRSEWRYRFSYAMGDLVSPQEMETLRLGRRAINDPAAAKLGVSPQQIQQLQSVPGGGMVVEAADRARIGVLFHQWLSASGRPATPSGTPPAQTSAKTAPQPVANGPSTTRPAALPSGSPQAVAAEKQLLAALGDIANRQLDATRKSYAARAQQIHTILGDGLLQKLKPTG